MYILLIYFRCNLSINTSKTIFILELRNIMPFCPDCGYKMLSTDRYCYNCGKQVFNEFSSLFEKTSLKTSSTSTIKINDIQGPKIDPFPGSSVSEQQDKENNYSKTESEILSLPYSWTMNNIEITLLGLGRVEGYERNNPLDNKKQFEVIIKFKNLLKTSNKITGGFLGFDKLNLKTDVGNTWDLKSNIENLTLSGSLDPEEEFIRNESVFEIREKELPEHLLAEIFGKKYVFAIKLITNRKNEENTEKYQLR